MICHKIQPTNKLHLMVSILYRNCNISEWREENTLWKTFFYFNERVEIVVCKRERERETDRQTDRLTDWQTETEDCYDWHNVEIPIFRAWLLWREIWYREIRRRTTPSDWPLRWKKISVFIYFLVRPLIFPSSAIHVIHFCCSLFALTHSCILFTKSTLTDCLRTICNIFVPSSSLIESGRIC